MYYPQTRALYYYWSGLKQGRLVPGREDIAPRQIKTILPNLFILERFDSNHFVFRLAGTAICERYGREFRAHNFLTLWRGEDRLQMRAHINDVITQQSPGFTTCRAETIDRFSVDAELLMLPLMDKFGAVTLILGCAYATSSTDDLGYRKLVNQRIIHSRLLLNPSTGLNTPAAPPPRPTHLGRPHLRLVVSRSQN